MSPAPDRLESALERRFAALAGRGVVACAVVPADGDPSELWPAERELVAAALDSRRREFAAGRASARQLLARLGFAPAPLLAASDRSPRWPSGALGAIAHDRRLCAVAVARAGQVAALGLDLEPDEALEEERWPALFTPGELDALRARPAAVRGRSARLLFSAKECVIECLRRPGLALADVEVTLLSRARFRARVWTRGASAGPGLPGFSLVHDGSILTGMALAPEPARSVRRGAAVLRFPLRASLGGRA